jgi:hypothetical protein
MRQTEGAKNNIRGCEKVFIHTYIPNEGPDGCVLWWYVVCDNCGARGYVLMNEEDDDETYQWGEGGFDCPRCGEDISFAKAEPKLPPWIT